MAKTKIIRTPAVWRPIDGFPSYEVSDQGSVRRWYDMTESRAAARERLGGPLWVDRFGGGDVFAIELAIAKDGTVGMEKVRDSKKYFRRVVSRLVRAAFPDLEALKGAA